MHRCYIQQKNWQGKYAFPSKEELHHITHVMRLKVGEAVELFDGEGHEVRAIVVNETGEHDSSICLKIVSDVKCIEQDLKLILFQAIPKGKRIDTLIEKCTELGVHEVVPMVTERVIVKIADQKSEQHKIARWQTIALSAAKQCGRADIPNISEVVNMSDVFEKHSRPDVMLVASLEDCAKDLQEVVQNLKAKSAETGQSFDCIGVFIGPEGDFTEKEYNFLVEKGAIPVSFGQLVMRVETAAIYATAILGYEFVNGKE
ncbi:MAG: RsmE family RNA methyltransferase [Kiritimatiellae bacterium]|jgi:16S rRNA (uracil1498-N3)-methyltransferase|nr:RsmE family RNA methyltransferase [Kiritimatiellia bacterium]